MDTMKPDWYNQLKTGPLKSSSPSVMQIQHITNSVTSRNAQRKKPLIWGVILATLLAAVVFFGLNLYQSSIKIQLQQAAVPGSQDWMNLQQAILESREYSSIKMLHVEAQKDGALVFYVRSQHGTNIDLSVDYMRRTFTGGWKWVHGGGFGSSPYKNKAVYSHYLKSPDAYTHIRTPFPILYGAFNTGEVSNIYVQFENNLDAQAVNFPMDDSMTGWFIYVPDKTRELQIIAKDRNGNIVETQKIDPS